MCLAKGSDHCYNYTVPVRWYSEGIKLKVVTYSLWSLCSTMFSVTTIPGQGKNRLSLSNADGALLFATTVVEIS